MFALIAGLAGYVVPRYPTDTTGDHEGAPPVP